MSEDSEIKNAMRAKIAADLRERIYTVNELLQKGHDLDLRMELGIEWSFGAPQIQLGEIKKTILY